MRWSEEEEDKREREKDGGMKLDALLAQLATWLTRSPGYILIGRLGRDYDSAEDK